MGRALLIAIFMFCVSPAKNSDFEKCYDNAMSTHDNLKCIDKEYSFYDKLLNRYYKEIMNYFRDDKKEQEYLREAQKAWIVYRDKKCIVEGYPMRDGSGESILVFGCKATETQKRAEELKIIAEDLRNYRR